ncbi:RuvX/YqgF family protein [Candidatus Bealeia paramacronuclearis]|uniref:Putative pre-16S rRNA nuclease n=1 Tax=Candidatus Bealeia paramacronuclearis TaxID=1921001 RepID=A0ABZ2C2T2_9PROT|nr:RuvX/YqgF family protein [Candidatus Bealeia paramacronuclearis]
MPLLTTSEFDIRTIPKGLRLGGFDVGEKTIGVALSDSLFMVASPLLVIQRKKWTQDLAIIQNLISEYQIYGIVIGLPLNMDGSEGPKCQSVRQVARNLLKEMDIPLVFWDERLSTVAVTRTLLEADMSRAKRKDNVDKMAASFILQGFLDLKRLT